ncbi:MAG TPA: SGNH/GDSL hydrolase family protein [Solirubrobacterales bacterium]|nr:SGNH/GDSL hydrolase family protein [Solirubrobacterales bacterium]
MKTSAIKHLAVVAAAAAALACAPGAAAKPPAASPPAKVEIGRVGIGTDPNGTSFLLLPVRYPIPYAGRVVEWRVRLLAADGSTVHAWVLHERLASGRVRRPDRRRRFTFVHRVALSPGLASRLGRGLSVRVFAGGPLDVNGDGVPEMRSRDSALQPLPRAPLGHGLCSSLPRLNARSGRRLSVPLPACDSDVRWHVLRGRTHGLVRIRKGRLIYRAPRRFRGRETIQLSGRVAGRGAVASASLVRYAQVAVAPAPGLVVRALGDSVTAGFGYYGDGASMTIGHLLECRPPATGFDDACSSNSLVTDNEEPLEYAPDYGLANNISWAAQWANEHAITDYENLAISGSEPSDWAPGGEFHATTAKIESEDPDYILMTVGANPLLSEMLFGIDHMGCAIYSDVFGGYRECVDRAFAQVHLRENLRRLDADLVQHTEATIYLMQYHLAVPSTALAYSATQVAEMGKLLNAEIAAVAAEVNPQRLQVVAPPHFDVGIDISPVYPSRFSCSSLGYEVDGPSVQSAPTQDELEVLHPLSFCEGPPIGPPWVISGDTGIHPSAAGYAQMASQVPPPQSWAGSRGRRR